jgi:hypothetical protein
MVVARIEPAMLRHGFQHMRTKDSRNPLARLVEVLRVKQRVLRQRFRRWGGLHGMRLMSLLS